MNGTVLKVAAVIMTCIVCSCQKESVEDVIKTDGTSGRSTSIFAGTDLHGVAIPGNLKALAQLASQNLGETAPSVFLLGGDFAKSTANMADSTMKNETYSLSSVIDEIKYGSRNRHGKYFFTFGSHDSECTDSPSAFFSGPAALDNYYLYGISYAQMAFSADSTVNMYNCQDTLDAFGKSAAAASAKFLNWANSLHDNAPIVIMSHMPMHANRGDNFGGATWCNAINQVAQYHNVFFLFGHNHTIDNAYIDGSLGGLEKPDSIMEKPDGPDDPMHNPDGPDGQGGSGETVNPDGPGGQEDPGANPDEMKNPFEEQDFYLVLPGDSIPIQTSRKNVFDTIQLNFTYLNAGYIKHGIASKITFFDINNDGTYDSVQIRRYTVSDTTITSFGSTGIANPYSANLPTNLQIKTLTCR